VRRPTISKWRRSEGFLEWLDDGLTRDVRLRWGQVLMVDWRFAMLGSVEHMRFWASVLLKTGGSSASWGHGQTEMQPQVIIN
jgi:hypothetical protein